MNACRPAAWYLLEQECHRILADRKVCRKPKVGNVVQAATGVELVTKVHGNGIVIETTDRLGRTWERERAFTGHWTVVG